MFFCQNNYFIAKMSNFFTLHYEPNKTIAPESNFRKTITTKLSSQKNRSHSKFKQQIVSKLLLLPMDHDVFLQTKTKDKTKKIVFEAVKEMKV
jgi:hypothetical protein